MDGRVNDMADLTAKLDQDRLTFLRTELSLSNTFAEMAETEYAIGDREAAARSVAHTEEAYATLRRFLEDPKHASHLTADQLRELNAGVENLRRKLDHVRRLHTPR